MKKTVYSLVALATILAGCAKEADIQNPKEETSGKKTVTLHVAVPDNADTKVSSDNSGSYEWQAEDEISALNTAGEVFSFKADGAGKAVNFNSSTFSGTMGTEAFYPASEYHTTGSFYLDPVIDWEENASFMPMLGTIDAEETVTFKPVGAVLKLICFNVSQDADNLVITSDSKQITGQFTPFGNPKAIATSDSQTNNSLTINFEKADSERSMVFYIPLPVGSVGKLTFTLSDGSNVLFEKTTKAAVPMVRNQILVAPVLNCGVYEDAKLTNEEIQAANLSGSYGSGSITSDSGTWNYNACIQEGKYMQIRNNTTTVSFLQLPSFEKEVASITLHSVSNGSNGAYTGSVHFRATASNTAESIASETCSVTAREDFTLSIPSGYKTGYIMSSGACRFSSVTVTFVGKAYTGPSITLDPEELTIPVGEGAYNETSATISYANPLDDFGIAVEMAADSWFEVVLDEGELRVLAPKNDTGEDRVGTFKLRATGITKAVAVSQPNAVVSNPVVTVKAGNALFNASWTAVPHAADYVAYLCVGEGEPTEGIDISSSISENDGVYSINEYAVSNDVTYCLYVKVAEASDEYIAPSVYVMKSFTPAEEKGTEEHPYSVSEAYEVISEYEGGQGPDGDTYIEGYVCSVSNPSSNYQTYFISDDGTNSGNRVQIYRGHGVNGANMTSSNRVYVGDYVLVYGSAINYYNSNSQTYQPELNTGSKIKVYKKKLAAPTFTPSESITYYAAQTVSISGPAGATIVYTTDGSIPTRENGSVYETAIVLSSTTTIKAIAYQEGSLDSEVAEATYTIQEPTVLVMSTVSCSAQTHNSLTFTWPAVEHAAGYQVSLDGGSSWQATQTAQTYSWIGLSAGTAKTLFVKAMGPSNGQYVESSPVSAEGTTPSLVSIEINPLPTKLSYVVGQTLSLEGATVTATYSDASTEEVTALVSTDGASVLASAGLQKDVTVTYVEGATKTATFKVDVKKAVTVSFSALTTSVDINNSVTNVAVTDPTGVAIRYSSADESIATVNATTGEVTGIAKGKVNITATVNDNEYDTTQSASYEMTVKDPEDVSVTYTVIKSGTIEEGTYLLGSNKADSFSSNTNIQLWGGTVSAASLVSSGYTWDSSSDAFLDDISGVAEVILEETGTQNVFYIKVGDKYLCSDSDGTQTGLSLSTTKTNTWTFAGRTGSGNDGFTLTSSYGQKLSCNSSAATNPMRNYKSSGIYYKGIYLFKKD